MKTKKKRKTDKIGTDFPTFNFDYNKVIDFQKGLKTNKEQIIYFNYVLKEKLNNKSSLDFDLYSDGPSFEEKIKNEIKFLKTKLGIEEPSGFKDKIVWMKNKHDFAFFFDKLYKDGFISFRKEKLKMLAEHFKWQDEEMTSMQLKSLFSNVNRKYGTQEPSDEMASILKNSKKN